MKLTALNSSEVLHFCGNTVACFGEEDSAVLVSGHQWTNGHHSDCNTLTWPELKIFCFGPN